MPVKDLSARPEMPKQDPAVRRHNFEEVALGLTPEQAINEAKRCLQCRNKPCVAGCPVEVPIPEFLELAAQGKFTEASLKIKQKNSLPAICGRVCPQETQCEEVCTLAKKYKPVAIGMMERSFPTTRGPIRKAAQRSGQEGLPQGGGGRLRSVWLDMRRGPRAHGLQGGHIRIPA